MMQAIAAFLRGLRNAVLEDAGIKAMALVFAVGLFVYLHRQEETFDRTFPIGVFVRQPPESANRELMTQIPPNVYVTLRGSARELEQLMRDRSIPAIELDLRDGQRQGVTFDASMLELPRGVEVSLFDPASIALEWQDVVSSTLPAQATLAGQPADGFVVGGQPKVDPALISVRGPKRLVEVMQFARLIAFDVSGLTDGVYRRQIALEPPPQRVNYGETSVVVTVTITRRVQRVEFDNVPVEVVGIANAVTTPRRVHVALVGPPEVVQALRVEQVVPRADLAAAGIDLSTQKRGSAVVPVTVDIANAQPQIQPPTVTVKW